MAETLAVMSGPDEAWEWLVSPNAHTRAGPPVALLEQGDVDAVLPAASRALDFA
jgi:hypothetical protein